MTTIGPAIFAGFVGAYLTVICHGTASAMEMNDRAPRSADHHEAMLGFPSSKADFYCGPTRYYGVDRATVELDTLRQQVIVFLSTWEGNQSEIGIHRSVLNGVMTRPDVSAVASIEQRNPYIRLQSSRITPDNDRIVANFRNNMAIQVKQQDGYSPKAASKFSGYKALLGRQTKRDENGRQVEVDVYFRIIIDWQYETPRAEELSVHRAAYVISEVPADSGDRPGREMYYRFPPSQAPFRLLACVPADAVAI